MRICEFGGCERKSHARGLCAAHYRQQARGLPLSPALPYRGQRVTPATGPGTCCTIDGCEKTVHSGGWCAMHNRRWLVHGDTSVSTTNRGVPMEVRFWMKVQKGPGCWPWTGSGRDGYGTFTETKGAPTHLAHRLAYALTLGPIPEGKILDHRCRNTICCNPAHLRPVTRKQNREHVDGAQRNSSTGALGVRRSINPSGDIRYRAVVIHNHKTYYNGSHKTIEEAAEAARQLRLSLFSHNDQDRNAA